MQDEAELRKEVNEEFERYFEGYVRAESLGSGIQVELLKMMAARFYKRGYCSAHDRAVHAAREYFQNMARRSMDSPWP